MKCEVCGTLGGFCQDERCQEIIKLRQMQKAATQWRYMPPSDLPEGVAFDYQFVAGQILEGCGPYKDPNEKYKPRKGTGHVYHYAEKSGKGKEG